MTRKACGRLARGFFAVGVYHPKTEANIGTLWRSAFIYGASFVFTVGRRYHAQASDTPRTPLHVPLFHFNTMDDLRTHLPHGCQLVGVELDDRAEDLWRFAHPDRACYLLGAEDHGLSPDVLAACHRVVRMRGEMSLNVAVAGSLVIYHRTESTTAKVRAMRSPA